MARTAAGLPSGTRLTYDISLGVLTAQCPIEDVQEALLSTGRVSERERDLPAHVASALRRRFRRRRASHRASTPLPRRTLDRVRDVERSGGGQHMARARRRERETGAAHSAKCVLRKTRVGTRRAPPHRCARPATAAYHVLRRGAHRARAKRRTRVRAGQLPRHDRASRCGTRVRRGDHDHAGEHRGALCLTARWTPALHQRFDTRVLHRSGRWSCVGAVGRQRPSVAPPCEWLRMDAKPARTRTACAASALRRGNKIHDGFQHTLAVMVQIDVVIRTQPKHNFRHSPEV